MHFQRTDPHILTHSHELCRTLALFNTFQKNKWECSPHILKFWNAYCILQNTSVFFIAYIKKQFTVHSNCVKNQLLKASLEKKINNKESHPIQLKKYSNYFTLKCSCFHAMTDSAIQNGHERAEVKQPTICWLSNN